MKTGVGRAGPHVPSQRTTFPPDSTGAARGVEAPGTTSPGRPEPGGCLEGTANLNPAANRHPAASRHPAANRVPAASRVPAANPGRALPLRTLLPAADLLSLGIAIGVTALTGIAGPIPLLLYPAGVAAALAAGGLSRLRICRRAADQAAALTAAATVPAMLLLPWLGADPALRLSLTTAGLLLTGRLVLYQILGAAHRHGRLTEPVALIGTGALGVYLAELMLARPELGLRPVGFLESGTRRRDLPLPLLGTPGDLGDVVAGLGIRRVIICHAGHGDEDLVSILRASAPLTADVCVVPRLYEIGALMPRYAGDELWGIPLVPLRLGHRTAALAAKRAFDVLVAAVLLVLAAPVIAILAALIRLESGPGIIFRQVRLTGPGRLTSIVKLRSLPAQGDSDTVWTVPAQQATCLGRWLRRTHLDELPQLFNVLGGSMSLVGPRPERPHFAAQFDRDIQGYPDRLRMRAGLTGWAQVHGLNGDTSVVERARFDNQYIENWSLWLDVLILGRTIAGLLHPVGGES